MEPGPVIELLDSTACFLDGRVPGRPAMAVVELGLQRGPERLLHRVVPAHTSSADGLLDAKSGTYIVELSGGVLGATVGVEHNSGRAAAGQDVSHAPRTFGQAPKPRRSGSCNSSF